MRGRPRRWRCIGDNPRSDYYKPAGIPAATLETTTLTAEETEALRLVDAEGLDQTAAAEKMTISQPTLSRELAAARHKVADALLNGKAIQLGTQREQEIRRQGIQQRRIGRGGAIMPNQDGTGPQGKGPRTGRGLGGCKSEPDEDQTPGTKGTNTNETPVPLGRGLGRGRGGMGRGLGMGRGRGQQN